MLKIKPRLDYMKSVKDTIDNYLDSFLVHQKIELRGLHCFSDYHITFGTNGKLKSVETSGQDRPSLKKSGGLKDYFADRKENRRCKSKVRHILRKTDLDFLHLKYEIYRTITFDVDDQIQLRDNTIYIRDTKKNAL